MAKTYTLHVAGLTRELPICKINDHLDIAAFIMFSDVELTIACAKALLEKCPDFDVILTAEAKGIPLAYEMSRQSGKQWIPARKVSRGTWRIRSSWRISPSPPLASRPWSLTKKDLDYMNGKRILVVDDVISTGGSLRITDAVWVALLAARGFSLWEIGLAESVFHIVSLLCEVPSGMAADLLGRKKTLVSGGVCMVLQSC